VITLDTDLLRQKIIFLLIKEMLMYEHITQEQLVEIMNTAYYDSLTDSERLLFSLGIFQLNEADVLRVVTQFYFKEKLSGPQLAEFLKKNEDRINTEFTRQFPANKKMTNGEFCCVVINIVADILNDQEKESAIS